MAKGIKFFFGEAARETSEFIEKFDNFFNAVNVTKYTSSFKSMKAFKMPYTTAVETSGSNYVVMLLHG